MNNLIDTFVTIFPLVLYMLVGVGVKKAKILDDSAMQQINSLVFRLFLPLSIFNNIYSSELGDVNPGPVVLYALIFNVVLFILAWIYFARFEKIRARRGVMIQASFRSNFVLFGMSLSMLLLDGTGTGIIEILLAVIIPLFNVMAVLALQYYGEEKTSPAKILRGILVNPLIIAVLIGLLVKTGGIVIPSYLKGPIASMGEIASPLALIVLAGQFNFHQSADYMSELIIGVSVRLIIVPVLALLGAILLGFRGEVLIAYLALFASPLAVSSYTMAQQIGGDHELAGQVLVYTTVFCSFTIFAFIFFLKQFAFI
ncbi:MAG: AEC family transporter [Tissierellia bacterium]|nr:AEC family transporter [Tissierellia bacterium]